MSLLRCTYAFPTGPKSALPPPDVFRFSCYVIIMHKRVESLQELRGLLSLVQILFPAPPFSPPSFLFSSVSNSFHSLSGLRSVAVCPHLLLTLTRTCGFVQHDTNVHVRKAPPSYAICSRPMLHNAQNHNTGVYAEPTRTIFVMAFGTGYAWRSNIAPIVELTDPSCAKK